MFILKKTVTILVLLTGVFAAYPGGTADKRIVEGKPVVAVSILPQKYFLERIGGNRVRALVLVGPGQSPHSYEPTPSQMAALSGSRAWILSGTDFEIGLRPKIASQFPELLIVDGTKGVSFRRLQEGEMEHEREHEDTHGEASHPGETDLPGTNIDRHTWLGYEASRVIAGNIRDALVALDPEGRAMYDANLTSLITDIDATFTDLKAALAPLAGKSVMVFHPSFGYFLDTFGIGQSPVETGGKEPSARALTALIARARAERVPAIFVQAQFPVAAAKTVAAQAGAQVVMLDPLAPNWLANIRRIGDALKRAYK